MSSISAGGSVVLDGSWTATVDSASMFLRLGVMGSDWSVIQVLVSMRFWSIAAVQGL